MTSTQTQSVVRGVAYAVALALLCLAVVQTRRASSSQDKTVAVLLMPVMSPGAEYAKPSEHPVGWRPSDESGPLAGYAPEFLQHYGRPLDAARKDVSMIRRMGANAVGICYSMPGNTARGGDQFTSIFNAYFQAVAEEGQVKFFPDIWGLFAKECFEKNVESLAAEFGYLRAKYEQAWLKKDGRFVVVIYPFDSPESLPPAKATLDRLCHMLGGPQNVYVVMYNGRQFTAPDSFFPGAPKNPEWLSASSAFSAWLNDSYGFTRRSIQDDRGFSATTGKDYWFPIFPAFAQVRGWPDAPRNVREMLGIANFIDSWKEAIRGKVKNVYLMTWNDLTEDSSFMPESNHGYAYYDLATYFNAWYLTGKRPKITDEEVLLFHHPQVVSGLQLPAGRTPIEGFQVGTNRGRPVPFGRFDFPRLNRTPPTDYIAVAGLLKEPATVRVLLNEEVLAEQALPAGVSAWLIYQPRYMNDSNGWYPRDDQAYPPGAGDFFITLLRQPLRDAEVYVEVTRAGQRMGFFRSHRPIVDAAGRGDMATVGDVFKLDHQ